MRRLLAVLGADVSRSLSPALHAAAAAALGLDIAYIPVSCVGESRFYAAVESLRTLNALGCNVTMPYKLAARARATEESEVVAQIGVANVLSFDWAGGVRADNTDGPGLVEVLSRLPRPLLERVQILGAGGAARAALWALYRAGARAVVVTTRNPGAADLPAEIRPFGRVEGATLVVSALPGEPILAEEALRSWIDVGARPFVLDLAYGAASTRSPLVRAAEAQGLLAEDGLDLLVEQAARSLALWTGGEVSAIRSAMKAHVSRGL